MPIHTKLDVINAAAAIIGVEAVQNLGDGTPNAAKYQRVYQHAEDICLGLYPWSFAKEIQPLAQSASHTSDLGYAYVFKLPSVRLQDPDFITDDATDPDRRYSRYAIVGDTVHADTTPLFAMIRTQPEPIRWSALFRSAMVTAVVAGLAQSIAGNKELAAQYHRDAFGTPSENMMGGLIGRAKKADAYSTPPRRADWAKNNPLINARRAG